jgi:hypothetical protein
MPLTLTFDSLSLSMTHARTTISSIIMKLFHSQLLLRCLLCWSGAANAAAAAHALALARISQPDSFFFHGSLHVGLALRGWRLATRQSAKVVQWARKRRESAIAKVLVGWRLAKLQCARRRIRAAESIKDGVQLCEKRLHRRLLCGSALSAWRQSVVRARALRSKKMKIMRSHHRRIIHIAFSVWAQHNRVKSRISLRLPSSVRTQHLSQRASVLPTRSVYTVSHHF